MNRHDRRKQRSQQRKAGSDTMGAAYQMGHELPAEVKNHPAFKAGKAAGEKGELPPEYVRQIERSAERVAAWIVSQPSPPELRWVEQKNDGVFIAAALEDVPHYLADSPDAFRLLAWLDEGQPADRKLSLNMAVWALRLAREIPMPDGSYYQGGSN
jgi:hypothetical protein